MKLRGLIFNTADTSDSDSALKHPVQMAFAVICQIPPCFSHHISKYRPNHWNSSSLLNLNKNVWYIPNILYLNFIYTISWLLSIRMFRQSKKGISTVLEKVILKGKWWKTQGYCFGESVISCCGLLAEDNICLSSIKIFYYVLFQLMFTFLVTVFVFENMHKIYFHPL